MHKKIGRSLLLFALLLTLLTAGFFLFKPLQGISAAQSDDHVPNAVFANGTPSDSLVYLPIAIHGDSFRTIFGYENGSINSGNGVNKMRQAGSNWVRRAGIWWPDVEPTKGTYDWSQLAGFETEFQLARSNNMEVVIIVRGTPSWAQADPPYNRACGRIKNSELPAFAAFMKELVTRYSGEPYSVKYWELYNEPDVDPTLVAAGNEWMGCWGEIGETNYGGEYYAEMLKVVYPEVKAADSNALVLVGGLLLDCDPLNPPPLKDCTPSNFLEGILDNGGGPYFDGISFHAYDFGYDWLGGYQNSNWASNWDTTGPSSLAKVDFLRSVLSTYNVTGKFLMNTEAALLCMGDRTFCETTKAYFVVHSYVAALKDDLRANLWYFWYDRSSQLFEKNLMMLPAYTTFAFARNQFKDASYNQEIMDYGGVRVYELDTPDGMMWVMWSLDGDPHLGLNLPSTPDTVYDAFGSSITPAATIDVDLKPLYLEWDS